MIIKINREEALFFVRKLYGRKAVKSIKKHKKIMKQSPELKKAWDDFLGEIDKILAYGGNKV